MVHWSKLKKLTDTILLTNPQTLLRFPQVLHSGPFTVPSWHITFSSHHSSASIWKFLSLSLSFMILALLKSTSQGSGRRMPFNLSLSVFSWLHWGDGFGEEHKRWSARLNTSSQRASPIKVTCTVMLTLTTWGSGDLPGYSPVKWLCFPFRTQLFASQSLSSPHTHKEENSTPSPGEKSFFRRCGHGLKPPE